MAQPDRDNPRAEEFRRRAEAMHQSLEQTMQDESDTIALLEKLERLAVTLQEHARNWDSVDPQVAQRVRAQETEVLALRAKVVGLVTADADDSAMIIQEIDRVLRQARES